MLAEKFLIKYIPGTLYDTTLFGINGLDAIMYVHMVLYIYTESQLRIRERSSNTITRIARDSLLSENEMIKIKSPLSHLTCYW